MSRIISYFLCSMVLCLSATGCAVAQQNSCNDVVCKDRKIAQGFWYTYYRNKHWPKPFTAMDTSAVMTHFEVQRNNGWKLHNTLGATMFDPSTNDLNAAGVAHVDWIVRKAPKDRRVVFVYKGEDSTQTAQRIESTQIAISRIIPTGSLPPIYLTNTDAPMASGAYQTAVTRAIEANMPAPSLPPASGSGSASSP
ncbi:MAG: hypothetical protein AAF483_18710 [Planctomycetota bacterium]